MMPAPLKTSKTFVEQIAILENRGMSVDDTDKAIKWLEQANYYRLTGYAFQFLTGGNKYRKATSFELMIKIYEFDQKLRNVLLLALEPIEIYARTSIAYYFSHLHGRSGDAHYDPANFTNPRYHAEYCKTLKAQIAKNKQAAFVNHHICKYGRKMPLWCAVEILPFSALSKLYSNMLITDKHVIATAMGFDLKYVDNWLHCFSVLRNTCAHYGRLYNVVLSPPISLGGKTLRRYPAVQNDTLFAYIIALLRFLPRQEQKESLRESVACLVRENLPFLELGLLGFPDEWERILYAPDIMTV